MHWNSIVTIQANGKDRRFKVVTSKSPTDYESKEPYTVMITEIDSLGNELPGFDIEHDIKNNTTDVPKELNDQPIIEILNEMDRQVRLGNESW